MVKKYHKHVKKTDKLGKILVVPMIHKVLICLVWRKFLQINMNKTNNPGRIYS